MNKAIIALVFVVGTLMVQCGANPSPLSYEKCVASNAKIISKATVSGELKKLVEEARTLYNKEPEKSKSESTPPKACGEIEEAIEQTAECKKDGKVHDYAKILADEIKENPKVKDVVEAYYVCQYGRLAGASLKEDGLFDLFKKA